MKAILVIDMPKNCKECAIKYRSEINGYWCFNLRNDEYASSVLPVNECRRDERCPLKPLPEKMAWGHSIEYVDGYNACIDEILGETE